MSIVDEGNFESEISKSLVSYSPKGKDNEFTTVYVENFSLNKNDHKRMKQFSFGN
jgi:hypothetical protein